MADVLATGRPCCPSAVGMRQTMTVLSMLQDTSMESSGDLSRKWSNVWRVVLFTRYFFVGPKVSWRQCFVPPVGIVVVVVEVDPVEPMLLNQCCCCGCGCCGGGGVMVMVIDVVQRMVLRLLFLRWLLVLMWHWWFVLLRQC